MVDFTVYGTEMFLFVCDTHGVALEASGEATGGKVVKDEVNREN